MSQTSAQLASDPSGSVLLQSRYTETGLDALNRDFLRPLIQRCPVSTDAEITKPRRYGIVYRSLIGNVSVRRILNVADQP